MGLGANMSEVDLMILGNISREDHLLLKIGLSSSITTSHHHSSHFSSI